MILALALALQEPEAGTDLVSLALRYLARHQADNGSWGRRPGGCACPDEPAPPAAPLDAPGLARVAALLEDLDADGGERRLRAQRALVREGRAAEPALREAGGSPERRARAADVLREIQGAATGEDVEVSSLALLAFLGAGYSHLSRDAHDGRVWGGVVRAGLRWLIDRQDEKGALADGAASAHAVATFALCEAYGLTGSKLYDAAAQKAVDVVVANPAKDARTCVWQVMVLKSAEMADLTFPRSANDALLADLKRRRSESPDSAFLQAGEVLARIFIQKSKDGLDLGGLPDVDPARLDVETSYLASLVLFQYDGPSGKRWKRHREVQTRWIVPSQAVERGRCARGSWAAPGTAARLKFAAHGALMNEIYYAYATLEK